MSGDANRANAVNVAEEIFNKGDLSKIDLYFSPDFVEHGTSPLPGNPSGREVIRFLATMMRTAFPDFHYTTEDVIEQEDTTKIAIRLTASGTNTGSFMGMPPTNRYATWSEVHIARMRNGQVVEHWPVVDQLSMLQQLGLAPTPGQ